MKQGMPDISVVQETLGMLFTCGVTVNARKSSGADPGKGDLVALYVGDDGEARAAGICDTAFAAYASSALSLIPEGPAKDAVKSGQLSTEMLGNLHEIMNVCARLIISWTGTHVKLDRVYAQAEQVPPDAGAKMSGSSRRLEFEIEVGSYGKGCLSLLSV